MPKLAVLSTKYLKGWDGKGPLPETIPVMDAVEALETAWPTDAHFAPYHVIGSDGEPEAFICRLNKGADEALLSKEGARVRFDLLVYDADVPGHGERTDKWVEEVLEGLGKLPEKIRQGVGFYMTRGGFRLLWTLKEGLGPSEYEAYRKAFAVGVLEPVGVEVDPNTNDWTRLYRLPDVMREGVRTGFDGVLEGLEVPLDWQPKHRGTFFDGIAKAKMPVAASALRATQGNRNNVMLTVAGKMRRMGFDFEGILSQLRLTNERQCDVPLSEDELETIARSVCRYAPEGGEETEAGDFVITRGTQPEIANYLVSKIESESRIVYDQGSFWILVENVWQRVEDKSIHRQIMAMDGYQYGQDAKTGKPKTISITDTTLKAVLTFMAVSTDIEGKGFFENRPDGVAFADGTFHKVVGKEITIEPLTPDHRVTWTFGYGWDAEARCDEWLRVLDRVWRDDDDKQQKMLALQEFMGACVFGVATKFSKAAWFKGGGKNGKSTILDVFARMFPPSQVRAVTPHMMAKDHYRASLVGAAMNIVREIPKNDLVETESFKALVTGEALMARELYKSPFLLVCKAGHVLAANALPMADDHTNGFRRRIILFDFCREIPTVEQNPAALKRMFDEEIPGIIAWARKGLERLLQQNCYTAIPSHFELEQEWVEAMDSVLSWSQDNTLKGEQKAGVLYDKYRVWCSGAGVMPLGLKKFCMRLSDMRYPKARKAGGIYYNIP